MIIKFIKKILKKYNCDNDFWGTIYYHDLEEVDNNVRYSFAIYEPIGWFDYTYDSIIYFIWLGWNSSFWKEVNKMKNYLLGVSTTVVFALFCYGLLRGVSYEW